MKPRKLCVHYIYEPSPIGLIGGCGLGLFGGLHAITCYYKGKCKSYSTRKEKEVSNENHSK